MMNQMMQETLTTGTARKADLPGIPAAGKTGTSQDFRDAWFVGYSGHLVAGVWLGNDDNSATKATGGSLPVEIWSRFMKGAHQGLPVADLPGVGNRTLDPAQPPATIPSTTPSSAPMTSMLAPMSAPPLAREDDMRPPAAIAPTRPPVVAVLPAPAAPPVRAPAPVPRPQVALARPVAKPKPQPATGTASLDAFILDRVLQQR